jgi:hypothetical protein
MKLIILRRFTRKCRQSHDYLSINKKTILFVISLTGILLAGIQPVQAQDLAKETIAFLDNRDLTANYNEAITDNGITTLTIETTIFNSDPNNAQKVELRLEGLDPTISDPVQNDILEIPKLDYANLKLTITFHQRPKTDTYQGVLVVISSPNGNIIRKNFVLKVPSPKASPTPSGVSYKADPMDTLTFKGRNLYPSIINPLQPFLIFVGIISFILVCVIFIGFFTYGFRTQFSFKRWLCFISLCLLSVFCLLWGFSIYKGLLIEPNPNKISIEPIPLATNEDPPTSIGLVAGNQDELGSVIQNKDQLVVTGIQHAGQFTGKAKLPSSQTSLTTTVYISDAWIWALGTIVLGVSLGFFITTYYSNRESEKAKRDAAQVWEYVAQKVSQIHARTYNQAQDEMLRDSVTKNIMTWLERHNNDSKHETYEKSNTRLDNFKKYFNEFSGNLDGLEEIKEKFRILNFKIKDKVNEIKIKLQIQNKWDIKSVQEVEDQINSNELFSFELDYVGNNNNSDSHKNITNKLNENLSKLEKLVISLYSLVSASNDLLSLPEDNRKGIIKQLENLPETGIENSDVFIEYLKKIMDDISKLVTMIRGSTLGLVSAESYVNRGKSAYIDEIVVINKPIVPAVPTSTIDTTKPVIKVIVSKPTWLKAEISSKSKYNVNDYFQFVSMNLVITQGNYLWDFDDETPLERAVVNPNSNIVTYHVFLKSGSHTVKLLDEMGITIAEKEVNISGPGYWVYISRYMNLNDRQMSTIVGLVAVGSGFLALYFKNPFWGTYQDYLAALLWGAIGSQGLKYVANIVNKVLPTG